MARTKDLGLQPLECNQSRELFYFRPCCVEDWSSGGGPQHLDRGLPTSAAYARAAGQFNHRCFEDTSAAAAIGFHEERISTAASKTCQVHFLCAPRHIHADSRVSDNLSTVATAGCPCRRERRTPHRFKWKKASELGLALVIEGLIDVQKGEKASSPKLDQQTLKMEGCRSL
jgi:hypothetical protein